LLPAGAAFGQAVYGNIFGTVTDNTGAVIPKATIVITDEAKGTAVTLESNDSGEFTAEHLIPDTYDIKVSATGFKTYETKGLTVFADTSAKVEASLMIGGAGETIEVNADTIPQLKTDRADVSTEFAAQQIQDLPIGDRNFTNLQLLLPGAQQLGWSHAADENPQGSKQIDVDGRPLAASLSSWTAPITRIRSWALSSSIRISIRSPKPRSRRRTSTRSSARQFRRW